MKMVVIDSNGSNMETQTAAEPTEPEEPKETQICPPSRPKPNTTLKILNKGPGYIRERMMRRNAGESFS